jgi:hypothetical protein
VSCWKYSVWLHDGRFVVPGILSTFHDLRRPIVLFLLTTLNQNPTVTTQKTKMEPAAICNW